MVNSPVLSTCSTGRSLYVTSSTYVPPSDASRPTIFREFPFSYWSIVSSLKLVFYYVIRLSTFLTICIYIYIHRVPCGYTYISTGIKLKVLRHTRECIRHKLFIFFLLFFRRICATPYESWFIVFLS